VEWLAASIEGGRPADSRFEELFEGYNSAKEYRTSAASPSTN
jgi:hypothetical protein